MRTLNVMPSMFNLIPPVYKEIGYILFPEYYTIKQKTRLTVGFFGRCFVVCCLLSLLFYINVL